MTAIEVCRKCAMITTRPGLTVDNDGVCSACRAHEKRSEVDYGARWGELEAKCDEHRRDDGKHDCLIAVSSGKDSWFQVATMVERLGMNPLLVTVDVFDSTQTGTANLFKMLDTWPCMLERVQLPHKTMRHWMKKAFERELIPTWAYDYAIYSAPIRKAIEHGIQLVIYGENVAWEYSGAGEDTLYAMAQFDNDVVKPIALEDWHDDVIGPKDTEPIRMPTQDEIDAAGIDPVYLSYAEPWSGYEHWQFARSRGWQDLRDTGEWRRAGLPEDLDQIDSVTYLAHPHQKWYKMAHTHATDIMSQWVREGRVTREFAVMWLLGNEFNMDANTLETFCHAIGIWPVEYWSTVTKHMNHELMEWTPNGIDRKEPVKRALLEGGRVFV